MGLAMRAWLAGEWRLARVIDDARAGTHGRLSGWAVFAPEGALAPGGAGVVLAPDGAGAMVAPDGAGVVLAPGGAGAMGAPDGAGASAPGGAGLVCDEEGVLEWGGGAYPTRNRTLWRFAPGRVAVLFGDGRPFHDFAPGAAAEAAHHCGADTYRVAYAFGAHAWTSRWQVRGPAKDYAMTTRYTRA